MSDQQSTQSLQAPEEAGQPTPTEIGADGSLEAGSGVATTPIPPPPTSPPTGLDERSNGRGPQPQGDVLLEVDRLVKYFPVRGGLLQRTVAQVKAVDDVSFFIRRGETLGLVGESGCGKTTVGRTILRLIPATGGEARFEGKN